MILIKNLSFFLDKKYKLKFFLITFLIFIGIILETFSIGSFIPLLNFIVKGKDYFLQNSFVQEKNTMSEGASGEREEELACWAREVGNGIPSELLGLLLLVLLLHGWLAGCCCCCCWLPGAELEKQ